MNEIIEIINNIELYLLQLGVFAPIFACLGIVLEAFIPILPILVFLSINIVILGNIFGFFVSYIFVVMASYFVYFLSRNFFDKRKINNIKINNFILLINKFNLFELTIIISFPYTPSSIVNLSSGYANVDDNKYLKSLLIGKFFNLLITFLIINGVLKNLNDPFMIIVFIIIGFVVYLVGYYINRFIMKGKLK